MQDSLTSLLDSPTDIWREVSAQIANPMLGGADESIKDAIQEQLDAGEEIILVWDYPSLTGKLSIERTAGIAGYIEGRLHGLGFIDLEVTFTRTDHDTSWVISLPTPDEHCVVHGINRCTICIKA